MLNRKIQRCPDLFATRKVLVVSGELNLAGGGDEEDKYSAFVLKLA